MPEEKYNRENITTMRKEAVGQMREMQRRASDGASGGWSGSPPRAQAGQSQNRAAQQRRQQGQNRQREEPKELPKNENKASLFGIGDLFKNILEGITGGVENSNLMILLVMAVVFAEVVKDGKLDFKNDDTYLLLALGYLLL